MVYNSSDWVNGTFESIGGIFLWYNVWRLSCDKKVKGVSVGSTAFFTLWSWWNLYFYPHNDLWLSFLGGLLIVSANTAWVALAVAYFYKDQEALEAEAEAKKKEPVVVVNKSYPTGDVWTFILNGQLVHMRPGESCWLHTHKDRVQVFHATASSPGVTYCPRCMGLSGGCPTCSGEQR